MKKKPTRIISRILSFTLAFMMMFSSFTSASAVDTGRTPDSIPHSTYIIGTHEFTSKTALTTSVIMMAARTIQGDNLTEEDMVIYYKNPRGDWINAINGTPIPENELPQSFTITHTDLEGEVVVDKTMLENFISTANNNRFSTFVSTDGSDVDPLAKWVTQVEMDDYKDAIEAAQTVADKADATLSEVDTALLALSQAMLNFDSVKKDGIVIVSAISVDKEATTLPVGTSETLVVTFDPTNATNKNVTWSSSDAEIATVADGVVTAVSEGTATITATSNNGKTATTTVTVVASNTVAMIGTTQYADLQNAIDAAAGTTINLVADVALTTNGLTIGIGKVVTLDLAGHVLSGVLENVGGSALITNRGSLTIEDSSTNKTGKITNQAENPDTEWEAGFPAYANNTITNSGELIINGGHIENTTNGGASYVIDNNSGNGNAIVKINGGYIVNPNNNHAIRQFANSTVNQNSVTINGGTVEGKRAVWIQLPGSSGQEKLADLTVNGGTLKSTDKGEGGYNLAVYSYTYGDSFANTKITINGGTFDGDVALTGGTRKAPMETVEVSNEAIFLGQRGVFSYANVVNETQNNGYTTIQEAIDAAEDGDTIQIAAGTYDESVVVPKDDVKDITILGANAETVPTSNDPNGTIITGGIYIGTDSGAEIDKEVTVKGITFNGGNGLLLGNIKTATVENNKFLNIEDTFNPSTTSTAAIAVINPYTGGTIRISNNYIDGVSGLGIYVRGTASSTVIEGNHVEATDHNSIQMVGKSKETNREVVIKNNELINWDQNRDADGGRAIRINFDPVDDSTALAVTGNTFLPNDDADPTDPDYVKITGVSTADNNVNNLISSLIDQNTWPSGTDYGTVILVNTTAGTSN